MNVQPIQPTARTTPYKQKMIDNLQLAPVYTMESLGPEHKDYVQPDGFTQFRVLEVGIPIAHFFGCMGRVNAQKFLRSKQLEVSAA